MSNRPDHFRIPPVDAADPASAELFESTLLRDGRPLNIFAVLAHHPKLLSRVNRFGGYLLNKGLVPERERELVILRVGWNARSRYEFGQHTIMGRDAGLTDEEIEAVTRPIAEGGWSADDAALLAMADELCADDGVTDETFARLHNRWSEPELVELIVVAGFYRLISGFLNTFGVELDEGVPGFPPAS